MANDPSGNGTARVTTLDDLVERDKTHDCPGYGPAGICVRVEAVAELPSRFGRFRIVAFWNNRDGKEHVAKLDEPVLVEDEVGSRLHGECANIPRMGA